MPNNALPENLRNKPHDDWPWPFKYVPRAWTSFIWTQPPKVIIGYRVNYWIQMPGRSPAEALKGPRDCQFDTWSWYLSWPLCFYIKLPFDIDFRIGARWDTADFYYTFPSLSLNKCGGPGRNTAREETKWIIYGKEYGGVL